MQVTINPPSNFLRKKVMANSSELNTCENYFSAKVSKYHIDMGFPCLSHLYQFINLNFPSVLWEYPKQNQTKMQEPL